MRRRAGDRPRPLRGYAPRIPLPALLDTAFLATAFLAAGFLAAVFLAAVLGAAGFLAAAFFAAGFLATVFLAAGFLAVVLVVVFLAAVVFLTAVVFLATVFLAAAGFLVAVFFAAGFFVAGVFDVAIFILHKNFRTFATTHYTPPNALSSSEDACGTGTVSTFKKTCNKIRKKFCLNYNIGAMIFSPAYSWGTVSRSRTRCTILPSTITSAARGRVL